MPILPTGHRVKVVPNWICEILSPSTKRQDRKDKMPLYAHYGVQYAWLTDPVERTLEVYRLNGNIWVEVGRSSMLPQIHSGIPVLRSCCLSS